MAKVTAATVVSLTQEETAALARDKSVEVTIDGKRVTIEGSGDSVESDDDAIEPQDELEEAIMSYGETTKIEEGDVVSSDNLVFDTGVVGRVLDVTAGEYITNMTGESRKLSDVLHSGEDVQVALVRPQGSPEATPDPVPVSALSLEKKA